MNTTIYFNVILFGDNKVACPILVALCLAIGGCSICGEIGYSIRVIHTNSFYYKFIGDRACFEVNVSLTSSPQTIKAVFMNDMSL